MKHPFALLVLVVIAAYAINVTFFPDARLPNIAPIDTIDRSDACFMSQKFVKQNLKAPATAEFPDWTADNCNASANGDTWRVRSFVDSQNGFGAMIRSDYGVEMRYNADKDTWTLLDIMIVSP